MRANYRVDEDHYIYRNTAKEVAKKYNRKVTPLHADRLFYLIHKIEDFKEQVGFLPKELVIDSFYEYFGENEFKLVSNSCKHDYSVKRAKVYYLLTRMCELSPSVLGKAFDQKRDTVTKSLKNTEIRINESEEFANDIYKIFRYLKGKLK